jgi:succinate-semialdehyde dehydrogenase/glutarate-semialdehyde dehydrogenase
MRISMAYASVNPADGKTLKTFTQMTDAQVETAIATATTAYAAWRKTTYAERANILNRASELMAAHVDDFARPMTLEMGKRIDEARSEVEFSSQILAYYAEKAERFRAPRKLDPKIGKARMESSPIGVIFGVEPWNFPFYQLARVAGPHLMAGNTIMIKHASIVPQCALAFEKLFTDAGAPKGLYTNLFVSHEQSDRIVDDQRIKGVALTGSVAAGRSISEENGVDFDQLALEQIRKGEPDQLDGPAADLDRTLDDEDPTNGR